MYNDTGLDWFFTYRDPADLIKHHASYFYLEVTTYICSTLCLIHSIRNGGRFPFLWFGTLFHSWTVECIAYFVPDIDNFWHAQNVLMFLGQRFPLYIMMFYVTFMYTTHIAASRLNLPWWALPFAIGILDPLVDIPYDIMGPKLVWWTWHDTDPNIYERFYWVPWTSFYFHATFASGFAIWFYGFHKLVTGKDRYEYAGFFKEFLVMIVSSLLGMPSGVIQFMIMYHPLHDYLKLHTELCVMFLLVVYGLIVWCGDRKAKSAGTSKKSWIDEVALAIMLWYGYYIALVNWGSKHPEDIVAIGLHERTGPCHPIVPVQTAFDQVFKLNLTKRKYFCTSDYDEDYFDWHCLPGGKPPANGLDWYTICGKPYENYDEYRILVTFVSLLGLFVFYQFLACSGSPVESVSKNKPKKKTQ